MCSDNHEICPQIWHSVRVELVDILRADRIAEVFATVSARSGIPVSFLRRCEQIRAGHIIRMHQMRIGFVDGFGGPTPAIHGARAER